MTHKARMTHKAQMTHKVPKRVLKTGLQVKWPRHLSRPKAPSHGHQILSNEEVSHAGPPEIPEIDPVSPSVATL